MLKLPQNVQDFLDGGPARRHANEKLNIYVCNVCGDHIVTVDLVVGVTPFMVGCRATEGCKGFMKSSMYRVFNQKMRPDFEWYRPDGLDGLTQGEVSHVQQGGLLLRPVLA